MSVSSGKQAVLDAFKKGKIGTDQWVNDDGYPVCPISTYAVHYGLDPKVFMYNEEDDQGNIIEDEFGFNDNEWVKAITKKFGIKKEVVQSLAQAWDYFDCGSDESNMLLNRKNLKELALSNMIDIFESKSRRKPKRNKK